MDLQVTHILELSDTDVKTILIVKGKNGKMEIITRKPESIKKN